MSAEVTAKAAETEALGARLARELKPGDVVLVSGDLGAGKTTFVRGACRALGVSDAVTSPTYTIGQRYSGAGAGISHLDLYRLDGLGAEEPGLLDDYLTPADIAFIEWPERAGELDLPPGVRLARTVAIRHDGGDRRRVTID